MAKAHITLPDGTTVNMEGTPAEIHDFIQQREEAQAKAPRRRGSRATSRGSLVDLIGSLIDGGFFKKPRDLAAVKAALEEMGHHYPLTSLSPTMLRQVRNRNLRRLKQDNKWMYTR